MFLVLICLVRRLLERPLLVFYLRIRAKKTSVNTRRMMPEVVFLVVLKCASGIVHQSEAL